MCRVLRKLEGREPDCENCLPPLWLENEEVVMVFNAVQGQVITAGARNEVVDVNHVSIHEAMSVYKVKDRRDCFEHVVKLFHDLRSEDGEV